MCRQIGKGRAGRRLRLRIAVGRIVNVPADFAFQSGVGGQGAAIAAVGSTEK